AAERLVAQSVAVLQDEARPEVEGQRRHFERNAVEEGEYDEPQPGVVAGPGADGPVECRASEQAEDGQDRHVEEDGADGGEELLPLVALDPGGSRFEFGGHGGSLPFVATGGPPVGGQPVATSHYSGGFFRVGGGHGRRGWYLAQRFTAPGPTFGGGPFA